MISKITDKLTSLPTWQLILVGVFASEVLTLFFSTLFSFTLWGHISYEIIVIGMMDGFIVATILIFFTIIIVKRIRIIECINKQLQVEITERNEAVDALQKMHEQLVHSEKLSAIGKLSASIAHEFNNPLYGIQSVLEGIKRNVDLDEELQKTTDLALSECDRVKDLIKSLQSFNRPSSGEKEAADMHVLLDEMLSMVKKEYNKANISIKKQYLPDLPRVQVVVDQIKQVFLNLLTNAKDAISSESGIVTITTENLGSEIAIRINDTGSGISTDDLPQIFEPFYTTKPAVKGTGLGLSVSYGIIKGHGGDIEVVSSPGKGTTFTILLPINPSNEVLP